MPLFLTHFDNQIKIRVFGAPKSQPQVKLGQSWQKSQNSLGLM